jgi:twitching motility protein PilT
LEPDDVRRILLDIATQEQLAIFEEKHELDFAYDYPQVARFRVNYLYARGNLQGVFRIIPHEIKTLEQLNMPPILRTLAGSPRGLVLVTGPTGSGKSTTLAAMMDHINSTKECHILTLEDPIEFVHQSKKALVSQRELHSDTFSFTSALKAALREDPDVILVGEMRDPETIELGLTAAETGHLVFGTLHTQDASQTVDRIIDSFAADQQAQIRAQLSLALQGVISQQLIRTIDGEGRVAALEVMIANSGIRNMLREGKTAQLYSAMQTGQKEGMQTMDTSLAQHIQSGKITKQTAATISSNPKELDRLIATGLKSIAPDLKRPSR